MVLGMYVSRVAEITGCITCNACDSRCDEGCVDCFGLVAVGGDEVFLGMMVSRSAEITGCITCNACES